VLKTPLAKPCVFFGNTDVIRRLDIVYNPSQPTGLSKTAMNAIAQYDQPGSMTAKKIGGAQARIVVPMTIQSARSRWTSIPVIMLTITPETGIGRRRIAACNVLKF
jgi:hypothetical protein